MGQGSAMIRVRVALAITNADDEILLLRQNGNSFWVLPGGTLEPGESLTTCGERELLEELGMTVRCEHVLGLSQFITNNRHVVDTVFYGTWLNEGAETLVMTTDENLDAFGWFSRQAVDELTVQPKGLWQNVCDGWDRDFPTPETPIYLD